MEHESNSDTNFNWCARNSKQRITSGTGGFGNKGTSGDHPNYSFVEIGQYTKKSLEDLSRIALTQSPVEIYLLMLVWETVKCVKL